MQINRREFLANAAVGTAGITAPSIIRAQTRSGPASSRDRLEEALRRIADPTGEGVRTCLTIYAESARAAADAADARARAGISLGPLDGRIVSIKDLFDVAGEPTRGGSKIFADAPPAKADAPVVRRLRSAGAVIVAKTNMAEFAFTIAGINPHYGTPGNPADRTRIPGGSSSGATVAVADGMCEISIGSDTGGSCRAPAAFCGTVGFKPSKFRIPTDGAIPLSYTLDSIGCFARKVSDCAMADTAMAGDAPWTVEPTPIQGLRLGIPQGFLLADFDPTVSAQFSEATTTLSRAGANLSNETISLFDDAIRVQARARITSVEAFSFHRQWLATRGGDYDPVVRARAELGRNVSAADYIAILRERAELVRALDVRLSDLDALLLPTTPRVAPRIAELAAMDVNTFIATDLLLGRNTAMMNFFDLCAISLPLPRQGGLPVGLMLVARNGEDRKLFRMAAAVEKLLAT